MRRVAARFVEIACPPRARAAGRVSRVLDELELLLGALPPASRRGLAAAFLAFDRGARLYPRSAGRRFTRLDDGTADAYLRALLAWQGSAGNAVRKLKSMVVMCYYELADVKEELGYRPGPYIAAVSRRRLAWHAAEIRRGEAAVLADGPPGPAGAPGPAGPARDTPPAGQANP